MKGFTAKRVTWTKAGKSANTKQQSTPTVPSAEQQSFTSGVEMADREIEQAEAVLRNQEHTVEMEQAQDQGSTDTEKTLDGHAKTAPFASDGQISRWISDAETELFQASIEKVRGEMHWRIRHLQTKKVLYDVYPEWRIQHHHSFWDATLCSCPTGYVRGAPCEHKAILRVWCARHRGAEGVKQLLDLPI